MYKWLRCQNSNQAIMHARFRRIVNSGHPGKFNNLKFEQMLRFGYNKGANILILTTPLITVIIL